MKKLTHIFLLASAFAAFSVSAEPTLQTVADPRPILDALQHKMSSVGTVYLEFTQERELKLFSEPLKSEGVMLIERPDKIRWETTAPYQTILLGDQKSVAQFEFNDGRWEKLKLGFPQLLQRVMQQMSAMNQGQLDTLTNEFSVSLATNSETVVTMTPKDKNVRSMMSSFEIHLEPDFSATREVVLNEPNGDLTRIIFHNEKRNVTFPPGAFDQTKPLPIAAVRAAVNHAP
ncbi:MAG TPA: outer membrane lipoprotein carrier protein LolA [Verrucomicrobiae bacterium]